MGRNFKLKGRTLLTADIIKPEIPYAEFSESILHMEAKNIINELNYGSKMLLKQDIEKKLIIPFGLAQ